MLSRTAINAPVRRRVTTRWAVGLAAAAVAALQLGFASPASAVAVSRAGFDYDFTWSDLVNLTTGTANPADVQVLTSVSADFDPDIRELRGNATVERQFTPGLPASGELGLRESFSTSVRVEARAEEADNRTAEAVFDGFGMGDIAIEFINNSTTDDYEFLFDLGFLVAVTTSVTDGILEGARSSAIIEIFGAGLDEFEQIFADTGLFATGLPATDDFGNVGSFGVALAPGEGAILDLRSFFVSGHVISVAEPAVTGVALAFVLLAAGGRRRTTAHRRDAARRV